jgi:hypothetical protein
MSGTLVFDAPRNGWAFFEAVIVDNLDLGWRRLIALGSLLGNPAPNNRSPTPWRRGSNKCSLNMHWAAMAFKPLALLVGYARDFMVSGARRGTRAAWRSSGCHGWVASFADEDERRSG